MSYHLACVSNRFAAIASVTGSMTLLTLAQCKNAKAIPVMEIHGTADPVVNYNGSAGVLSIPEVLDYWIEKNSLNKQDLVQTNVTDINTGDNATAELYMYPGMNEVQHYKIINGGHTWPGTPFIIGTTCQDFKASEVIWQFFAKYKRQTVSTKDLIVGELQLNPNPTVDALEISITDYNNLPQSLDCLNQFGIKIKSFSIQSAQSQLEVSDLPSGIYFLLGQSASKFYRTKFIKL